MEELFKNRKTTLVSTVTFVVLAVIACVAIGISRNSKPEPTAGEKTVVFTVVHASGEEKVFSLKTEEEYLANALKEGGVIPEIDESGMYSEFDGEKADWSVDNGWWCITKDDEMVMEGINILPIADGDKYEATYTKG